jgi:hypothetical protein
VDVVLVDDEVVDATVDDVVPAQPPSVHASQQLGKTLTQAVPPPGGVHCSADRLSEHLVRPFFVRQQATAPGLPHADFAAHFLTAPRQFLGSAGSSFASCATHLTYCP